MRDIPRTMTKRDFDIIGDQKNMRLLICVPSNDFMHVAFVKSLTNLIRRLDKGFVQYDVRIMDGTMVHVARDNLAKLAVNEKYTHTLWLDSDMVFSDDLLDDLMFGDKDFVSGIYHARRPPHGSCIFKSINPMQIQRYELEDYPNNTFEIAGCGFGCVLIKTDIIRDVLSRFGSAFCPTEALGEDLAFCQRVHDLGHKMYCEPGVRVGHIGHITIYPDDRAYWAELGGMT